VGQGCWGRRQEQSRKQQDIEHESGFHRCPLIAPTEGFRLAIFAMAIGGP
jgi:hypothetical protein